LRRSLSGVVMSIKGHSHIVKTEFGKEYTVDIKHSSLTAGDDVHISFDFTEGRIIALHGKEVAFTDDDAIHDPECSNKTPFLEDED